MLSFPSKNDKKKFFWLDRCAQKTDLGDGKPTYFYIWSYTSYIYYTECIKLIDIKNLPCKTSGLQCLCLSKIGHLEQLELTYP